jgi:hypothetical protein
MIAANLLDCWLVTNLLAQTRWPGVRKKGASTAP